MQSVIDRDHKIEELLKWENEEDIIACLIAFNPKEQGLAKQGEVWIGKYYYVASLIHVFV